MEKFIKGDVVVVPFPFSDLTNSKKRPALVLAKLDGDDVILCQITGRQLSDRYSITLEEKDFTAGSLNQTSNIRPNRIFTADKNIILYRAARLNSNKTKKVIEKIIDILHEQPI